MKAVFAVFVSERQRVSVYGDVDWHQSGRLVPWCLRYLLLT